MSDGAAISFAVRVVASTALCLCLLAACQAGGDKDAAGVITTTGEWQTINEKESYESTKGFLKIIKTWSDIYNGIFAVSYNEFAAFFPYISDLREFKKYITGLATFRKVNFKQSVLGYHIEERLKQI